jgi:hypothetical protein
MIDFFEFSAPFGFIGRFAEIAFLKSYMTKFLKKRNMEIKTAAEGESWRQII